MYQKHKMDVIHYEENAYVVASGVDEGSVEVGPVPVLPDDD